MSLLLQQRIRPTGVQFLRRNCTVVDYISRQRGLLSFNFTFSSTFDRSIWAIWCVNNYLCGWDNIGSDENIISRSTLSQFQKSFPRLVSAGFQQGSSKKKKKRYPFSHKVYSTCYFFLFFFFSFHFLFRNWLTCSKTLCVYKTVFAVFPSPACNPIFRNEKITRNY